MTIMHFSTITDPYVTARGNRRGTARGSYQKHKPRGGIDNQRFIAIDGEGITLAGGEHRYVLLGAGQDQIVSSKLDTFHWREIFGFLYSKYQPKTAFVGFYLGYDFTQWLRTLPQERATRLLTIEGRESRRSKSKAMHGKILPLDLYDWQIDMLGTRRMKIRPKVCDCPTVKCVHKKNPWLNICDCGPFFQTSFLNVINPRHWDEPVVTQEEYEIVLQGKERRSTAQLDDDMMFYNRLENELLERVMADLNGSMKTLSVYLSAAQFIGPGQAAQEWLKHTPCITTSEITDLPELKTVSDAARASYFGGWFEIMAHGIVPGISYEYDINSAYPDIISKLPCLKHLSVTRGHGKPPADEPSRYTLMRALVWSRPYYSDYRHDVLGAMLHRDNKGSICRPIVTAGWYWKHELDAARSAKALTRINNDRIYEWISFKPTCDCPTPIGAIQGLYDLRLRVGKTSSLSKAAKLIANSVYGKTAQSTGLPIFGNPIYASLITSLTRTKILDAITSHPEGKDAVLMVATDAVFFTSPHPGLEISNTLGSWELKERENLTLFKPGVYWDDSARDAIALGENAAFKARGISAKDFGEKISDIDYAFSAWDTFSDIDLHKVPMPSISIDVNFSMVSALQACIRNDWNSAGNIEQGKVNKQSANPSKKRQQLYRVQLPDGRTIYRTDPLLTGDNATLDPDNFYSVPYEKKFGMEDPFSDEYQQELGIVPDDSMPLRSHFRLLTGQE